MEPWEKLHQFSLHDGQLRPLRKHSQNLATTMRYLVEHGADERGVKEAWGALKAARDKVKTLDLDDFKRDLIHQHCLQIKTSIDRVQINNLAGVSEKSPDARFAALAFLYARGGLEDRVLLNRISNLSEHEGGLKKRVEKELEVREREQKRMSLLYEYHALVFRFQRREGTTSDESRLVTIMNDLEKMDGRAIRLELDPNVESLLRGLEALESQLREAFGKFLNRQ